MVGYHGTFFSIFGFHLVDIWSPEKLKGYLCHIKTISPIMTEPANQLVLVLALYVKLISFQSTFKVLSITATS